MQQGDSFCRVIKNHNFNHPSGYWFMEHNNRYIARHRKLTSLILGFLCCILFSSNGKQSDPRLFVPAILQSQLQQYQQNNNLTEWIYSQLDWVSKAPAERALLLKQAATTAWRKPESNQEIQAWLDLLINEGYMLLISGDIVASTDAYSAAFAWAREHQELENDALVLENI
jgi:hypothetical protein